MSNLNKFYSYQYQYLKIKIVKSCLKSIRYENIYSWFKYWYALVIQEMQSINI